MVKKKRSTIPGRKKSKAMRSKGSILNPLMFAIFLITLALFAYYYYKRDVKIISTKELLVTIPEGFESFGIDISHHQGKIDWEELMIAQGFDSVVRFVYCKATEGASFIDSRWEENRTTLNEMNIPNGAYHFFSPKSPPRPQVDHFLSVWKKGDIDLPPVLDVESEGFSDNDLKAKMKIWLEEVEKQTGMRPVIYTSLHFFETKFTNDFNDYKFWIAAYSRKPACIEDGRVIHWQYSDAGQLPGIDELVDLNVSKVSYQ
jgi:lysozyme